MFILHLFNLLFRKETAKNVRKRRISERMSVSEIKLRQLQATVCMLYVLLQLTAVAADSLAFLA